MALTHLKVERSGPRKKLYEEGDGGGLYLRVHPTGSKSWLFRYVFEGERKRMTLGSYPSMSLAEAREAHGKALADVKRCIDPGA